MKHEVFWKNPGYKVRPELKEDIECDYLIVGGGVTGVSLAYFLSKHKSKKCSPSHPNGMKPGPSPRAGLYRSIQLFLFVPVLHHHLNELIIPKIPLLGHF